MTTGAPWSVAAESPTTMNCTLRFSSTRNRLSSLSENGSGAATNKTSLQSLERRLLEQNQGVPDVLAISIGMRRNNFFDAF